jgi:hypothetical protein
MAEIPVEHSQPAYSTKPKVPLTQVSNNGPSFFSMLFGGGSQPAPQPAAPVKRPRRAVGPR